MPGGGAVGVEEDRAAVGNERLSSVQLVESDAAALEHPFHVVGHAFVDVHPRAEELGQGPLRDVVLRGAQTARDDDDLAVGQRPLQRLYDLCPVVADRALLAHDDAGGIQVFRDGYGVGVDDLSDQDLVADGDDGCLHGS